MGQVIPEKPLRVVVWSTGTIGRHAIAGVDTHPDLELVGVWTSTDAKDGRDAGELAGLGRELGIKATTDREALIALAMLSLQVLWAPRLILNLILNLPLNPSRNFNADFTLNLNLSLSLKTTALEKASQRVTVRASARRRWTKSFANAGPPWVFAS